MLYVQIVVTSEPKADDVFRSKLRHIKLDEARFQVMWIT